MKYESNILERLIKTYGVVGNPKYVSEIIKQFLIQGKECYPNLFTYQSDWLSHIDEFGLTNDYVVSYTGQRFYAPNTMEGSVKRAILKGQTLVNLAPRGTIDYTASSDWDGYQQLIQNSKQSSDSWRTLQDLKPNTKYFISCYVETFNVGENQDYLLNNPNHSTVFAEFLEVKATGLHKWVLTSKSEFTEEVSIALRCQNKNARGAIKIRDIMIIEYQDGMENWDIPYFEGMQSVKMPGLTTTGKNLFNYLSYQEKKDYTKYEPEKIIINSPTQYLPTQYDLVLEEGKTYVLSTEKTPGAEISVRRSNDSSIIYDTESTNYKITFVAENNMFLRISNRKIINEDVWFSNIQIEEGATATPFEPYQSNILTVNEDVTLRSNGSVCDELDLLTGKLTQRIDEDVEVLTQEVVKTVDLNIKDHNHQKVERLTSFEGGTHFDVSSQTGTLLPTLEVDVVVDLEGTLMTCSTEGNTM